MVLKVIDNGHDQELLPTLGLQRELVERKIKGDSTDYLILLEHAPSVTTGKNPTGTNFIADSLASNTPCYEVNRAGKDIFHCRGQLAIYPIFDLRAKGMDVQVFSEKLEMAIINALKVLGIVSFKEPGLSGLWTRSNGQRRSIASSGLSLKHWTSYNGIWLNVYNEQLGKGETNVKTELAEKDALRLSELRCKHSTLEVSPEESLMQEVKRQIVSAFQKVFNFQTVKSVNAKDVLPTFNKPRWLSDRRPQGTADFLKVKSVLDMFEVATSCEEKHCPNLGDCWSKRCISFSIPQDESHLERAHVSSLRIASYGLSSEQWKKVQSLDETEPLRFAVVVKQLGLRHVVFSVPVTNTSSSRAVYRFCRAVKQVKEVNPSCRIEAEVNSLQIGDFHGLPEHGYGVLGTGVVDVVSCNLPILSAIDGVSEAFLSLLYWAKKFDRNVTTKAELLVGAGETIKDVISVIKTLRCVDCDLLSLGQYLQPNSSSPQLHRFVTPEEFAYLKDLAVEAGFKHVISEPLARNSYLAWQKSQLQQNIEVIVENRASEPNTNKTRQSLTESIEVISSHAHEKTTPQASYLNRRTMVR